MPNFLIIGAAKSGTTSLAEYLAQHPQVYISPVKEPMFFGLEGADLPFRNPDDSTIYYRSPYTLSQYQDLFQGVTTEVAVGEASTWYIYLPKAPDCIRQTLPNVRLIAILRHPADRAFSAFQYMRQGNQEPLHDFAAALHAEEERIQQGCLPHWHYKQAGFYYKQMHRYYQMFAPQQIKVYLYEDLLKKPQALLRDIFQFLDIDDTFLPHTSQRYNVSGVPRNMIFKTFLHNKSTMKSALKMLIPSRMRSCIRMRMHQKIQFDPAVRHELTRTYHEDILHLQDLIQRDLSAWLDV